MFFRDESNNWTRFYAWRPVYIGNRLRNSRDGKHVWAWLEWVERREAGAWEGAGMMSSWVYRMPGTRVAGVAGEEWSR